MKFNQIKYILSIGKNHFKSSSSWKWIFILNIKILCTIFGEFTNIIPRSTHRIFTRIEYFTEKKIHHTEKVLRILLGYLRECLSIQSPLRFRPYKHTYFRTHIFLYTHYYTTVHKRWTFLSERPRCDPGAAADWWHSLAPLPLRFFSNSLTNENVGHYITRFSLRFVCVGINAWGPFVFRRIGFGFRARY